MRFICPKVDHEAPIADRQAREAVPSVAHGDQEAGSPCEPHGSDHIRHPGAARDQCRSPIDRPVPDLPVLVVGRVARTDELSSKRARELAQGSVHRALCLQRSRSTCCCKARRDLNEPARRPVRARHSVVRTFIDDVRGSIAAAADPAGACTRIRPRFAELLADLDWLPPAYQEPPPESGMGGGIGQWLLYRAAGGSLSLFSLVIPPGAQTPVHDHLAWGSSGSTGNRERGDLCRGRRSARAAQATRARGGRLLRPDPAPRRHPPGADDVDRHLGVDPPAHQRHGLRLAARVRPRLGRGATVPVGLRERRLRGGRWLAVSCERSPLPAGWFGLVRAHRPT
jgi:hypothetical protein